MAPNGRDEKSCMYHAEHKTRITRNEKDIEHIHTVIEKLETGIDNLQKNLNKLVVKFALVNGAILGIAQAIPIVIKLIK